MHQKEKPRIKSQGVKTFEQNEDVYIFLVLPKYHISSFSTALQNLQKIVTCFSRRLIQLNLLWSSNSKSFPAPALNDHVIAMVYIQKDTVQHFESPKHSIFIVYSIFINPWRISKNMVLS